MELFHKCSLPVPQRMIGQLSDMSLPELDPSQMSWFPRFLDAQTWFCHRGWQGAIRETIWNHFPAVICSHTSPNWISVSHEYLQSAALPEYKDSALSDMILVRGRKYNLKDQVARLGVLQMRRKVLALAIAQNRWSRSMTAASHQPLNITARRHLNTGMFVSWVGSACSHRWVLVSRQVNDLDLKRTSSQSNVGQNPIKPIETLTKIKSKRLVCLVQKFLKLHSTLSSLSVYVYFFMM